MLKHIARSRQQAAPIRFKQPAAAPSFEGAVKHKWIGLAETCAVAPQKLGLPAATTKNGDCGAPVDITTQPSFGPRRCFSRMRTPRGASTRP
jgi:hypothetical protein